jgi:hypothetical protein
VNQRFKYVLRFVFDLRTFILAFAIFNFVVVWRNANGCHGVVNPWDCSWSYTNEPTILLVAALLLRLNRWLGNLVSLALTGYLLGYFLQLLAACYQPWECLRNDWKVIRGNYPYIVGSWDSQYFFALIIFCCSGFFLTRGILRWRASRRTADNKSLDRSHGERVSHQA